MAFIFSYRYFVGRVPADSSVNAPLVPAGYRFIIKSVDISQVYGATTATALIFPATNTALVRLASTSGTGDAHWTGSQVLHEGERVAVRTYGALSDVAVSGYLLPGSGGPLTAGTLPAP